MESESEELVARKRKYAGEILTVNAVTASTEDLDNPALVLVGIQHKVPILEHDGTLTAASPQMKVNFRLHLKWGSSGWRVEDVANA